MNRSFKSNIKYIHIHRTSTWCKLAFTSSKCIYSECYFLFKIYRIFLYTWITHRLFLTSINTQYKSQLTHSSNEMITMTRTAAIHTWSVFCYITQRCRNTIFSVAFSFVYSISRFHDILIIISDIDLYFHWS